MAVCISAGILAAAIALVPNASLKFILLGLAALGLSFSAVCDEPHRWLYLFFTVDLLSPPLPGVQGSPGIHLAPLGVMVVELGS